MIPHMYTSLLNKYNHYKYKMDIFLLIFLFAIGIILIIYILRYLKLSFPNYFSSSKKVYKKKDIEKAKTHIKHGNFKYAENIFLKTKDKLSGYDDIRNKAYKYFENQKFKQVIKTFEPLTKTNNLNNNDLFHIGLSFYKLSDFEKAKYYLFETIKKDHEHEHALKHLISLYLIDNKLNELYKKLENIINKKDSLKILESLAEINKKTKNKQGLKEIYLRILKINKDHFEASSYLEKN